MLISRSIISWFAELGEASNQSNSPASIPRTIHQCHHCTGALSSSTSSISFSSLSSSNHHHWSSPSSSSVALRPKTGQWSFRSRCQICKKHLCTGPRCSTGDQMFLLMSIQMVKLVSSGNHNISHDDNYYGAHWEKRVGTSVPFFSSRPKVVPE